MQRRELYLYVYFLLRLYEEVKVEEIFCEDFTYIRDFIYIFGLWNVPGTGDVKKTTSPCIIGAGHTLRPSYLVDHRIRGHIFYWQSIMRSWMLGFYSSQAIGEAFGSENHKPIDLLGIVMTNHIPSKLPDQLVWCNRLVKRERKNWLVVANADSQSSCLHAA